MRVVKDRKKYEGAKLFNTEHALLLNNLTTPLERYFGFRLFTYRRVYDDGTFFQICSNAQWIDCCFDKELWISQKMQDRSRNLSCYESKQYLWIHDMTDPLYYNLHSYNIWNGVSYYKRYPNYTELIAYASNRENNLVMDYYISESNILQKFNFFFKEKTKKILDKAADFTFSINSPVPFLQNSLGAEKNNVLREFLPKRYYITDNECGYLTQKEMDIVELCLRGKTTKEIAINLAVSPRTVETHIEQIKDKFNLVSKNDLTGFFRKTL